MLKNDLQLRLSLIHMCLLVHNILVFVSSCFKWPRSSWRRRNTSWWDLLLSKVVLASRSPAPLSHLLFSLTLAHAPHCSTPCPHCLRKRRIPPRTWTARPALPVQWVTKSKYSVFGKSMWGHEICHRIIHLALVRKFYQCCSWTSCPRGFFFDLKMLLIVKQ